MKLDYCTFTGADDEVDPKQLAQLSRAYPWVEWAVLISAGEQGTPRVPSAKWLQRFQKECTKANVAAHLCKESLTRFLKSDENTIKLIAPVPRIQLNFAYEFDARTVDEQQLAARVASMPNQFILQYNNKTHHLLRNCLSLPNLSILFDASTGRGITPKIWPKPFPALQCGYAGGIGPDNIETVLESLLLTMLPSTRSIWIDMETGIRTDNRFDLGKVQNVLDSVKIFAARPHGTNMKSLLALDL